MNTLKPYTKEQILAKPFQEICKYRRDMMQKYFQYTPQEQQVIAQANAIIDAPYRASVVIGKDQIEFKLGYLEESLKNITKHDLLILTHYRHLTLTKMRAVPLNVLHNLQIIKEHFGNL